MTVAEFIPEFLELIAKDHSPTTIHSYKRVCEAYILPALGHRKMREITPLDVQKFVQQLENLPPADRTGKREAADSSRISPATVKRYYCVLQSLLATPVNWPDSRKPRQFCPDHSTPADA